MHHFDCRTILDYKLFTLIKKKLKKIHKNYYYFVSVRSSLLLLPVSFSFISKWHQFFIGYIGITEFIQGTCGHMSGLTIFVGLTKLLTSFKRFVYSKVYTFIYFGILFDIFASSNAYEYQHNFFFNLFQ